jgi:uncharacterized protein (DUF1015 family)
LAEISPFRGIRYNKDKIKDMEAVLCPPYDIISPEEQKAYHDNNEYNVIRLEHGLQSARDTAKDNKHIRARDTLNSWLKDGILKTDNTESFYIYEQGFVYADTKKKRLGLIACIKLEEWEKKIIFPHESTSQKVKQDRLELMRATDANISPILGLYEDPGNKVTKLMQGKMLPSKVVVDIDNGIETHKVWRANEPEFVQRVFHFITPKSIYIADGHHRYETALAYRDERHKSDHTHNSYAAYNFVMMTLVSFSDPGILMLPIHRMVNGLPAKILSGLLNHLSEFFEIKTVPLKGINLNETQGTAIRLVGLDKGNLLSLKLLPSAPINEIMPQGRSSVYKRLDVSIVEHLITEKLLGIHDIAERITYTHDAMEACKLVEDGTFQLGILLNPLPVTTIKSIADASDRMPRKSTYFYPKLPTGLVLNRLDGKM